MKNTPPSFRGVPFWVETLQPDAETARRFYSELFGWAFDRVSPASAGSTGEYWVARVDGESVSGMSQAPQPQAPALWGMYVHVENVDASLRDVAAAGGGVLVGPSELGDWGRRAVISDPSGVALGIWEPRGFGGAQRVNEVSAWAMSALHTPSLRLAEAFYGRLFGWELQMALDGSLGVWRLPGYGGSAANPRLPSDAVAVATSIQKGDPTPPHWATSFRVETVDATVEAAESLGATILMGPTDRAGIRSALIADPQGGVFGLSSMPPDRVGPTDEPGR